MPWFLAFLVLTAGILLYFLYFEKTAPPSSSNFGQQSPANGVENQEGTVPSQLQNQSGAKDLPEGIEKPTELSSIEQENSSETPDSATSIENVNPQDPPEPDMVEAGNGKSCKPAIRTIKDFYSHLDQQEYLKPYQLDKQSEQYFSALLQKVVDNPPIVSGETDDLFNILKNTAHFFRIVGKKNIFTLKAILDREKDSFENVLAEFYKLTDHPACLKDGFGLQIPESALYDYAGFFLNTMGGRLYLFRRDSVSRMAVSYYSILIVDKANNTGTNKHGIDVIPAIRSLIDELENNGSRLRLRDDYLDTLYRLEEKYL